METNKYKNYLEDCLEELLQRAEEAKITADNSNVDFDKGRWLGYYEAMTYLLSQTEVFEIKDDLKESIREHNPLRY